jgi:hypothetical protein
VTGAGGRSVRDCFVWAVIIGGHALLILVFTSSKRVQSTAVDSPSPGVLLLLDLPSEAESLEPVPQAPQLASVPVITPRLPAPDIDTESTAITLPDEAQPEGPGTNAIDWRREAERSARAVVEQGAKSVEKHIGEHPPVPSAFQKKKPPKEFPWDPEPKKAGFAAGFIPYVVIGQRCVVGLGFFGCALGKKPPANSHLFDGMHDPDRQRSSVPDVDTSRGLDPPPD